MFKGWEEEGESKNNWKYCGRYREEPEEYCVFEAKKERILRYNKWSAISNK